MTLKTAYKESVEKQVKDRTESIAKNREEVAEFSKIWFIFRQDLLELRSSHLEGWVEVSPKLRLWWPKDNSRTFQLQIKTNSSFETFNVIEDLPNKKAELQEKGHHRSVLHAIRACLELDE